MAVMQKSSDGVVSITIESADRPQHHGMEKGEEEPVNSAGQS